MPPRPGIDRARGAALVAASANSLGRRIDACGGKMTLRRWLGLSLAVVVALLPGFLVVDSVLAQTKPAPPPASAGGPAWNQLSAQQREALAPLAEYWASMSADRRRKWLEIAEIYPRLSPDGKARIHARMVDFVQLTPEQRETARENFRRAYELPRESRESTLQQYQTLPDEQKKALTERSQRKDPAKAPEKKP